MVLLWLARRLLAPRVPEDEERKDCKREKHAEHCTEERARMHVPAAGCADKAERGDGDSEGENRPEERCEWEREEAREQRQATAVSVGAEAEVPTLKKKKEDESWHDGEGGKRRQRTASSSSASARRRWRQTWCTPMTIESIENSVEMSDAVCAMVLMFCRGGGNERNGSGSVPCAN